MIPIEKNIIVVDEKGNEYEATYPKRAKGLVKNGRAHYIEENKICLLHPPNLKSEDNDMPDTKAAKAKDKLTIKYVLDKAEQIINDTEYIHSALEQLALMPKSDPGDIAGQEKAKAIGEIVRCREATNQQALKFYKKMYDVLHPIGTNRFWRIKFSHTFAAKPYNTSVLSHFAASVRKNFISDKTAAHPKTSDFSVRRT